MSSLVCGLTGTTPEEPVFSKTGYIYERRAIEKYLKVNGDICPLSGELLTVDDLMQIKVNKSVKPRPVTAMSIPGLLSLMQNEWDSLMAETFSLRNHLDTVRQQLSHSLYQHDAACRVIARLIKERDGIRHHLSQLQDSHTHSAAEDSLLAGVTLSDVSADVGLSAEVIQEWSTLAKTLLCQRKKRSFERLTAAETIRSWKESSSFSVHSSTSPGVTCCTNAAGCLESKAVWTGGVDGVVARFDWNEQKTTTRLLGHLKKINQVMTHATENVILSASDDKTVRVWSSPDSSSNEYKTSWILRRHQKAVTSLSLHPSGDYFTSSGKDRVWGIHDLHSGQTCRTYTSTPSEFSCLSFHPDGMLVGASGADGNIYLYDIKDSLDPMASLAAHPESTVSLAFSENGYYLMTAGRSGSVKLWDLRKSTNFETINPPSETSPQLIPSVVKFDNSGMHFAICGTEVNDRGSTGHLSVYSFETKTKVCKTNVFDSHLDTVTDITFGPDAAYLISGSLDRTIRLWSP